MIIRSVKMENFRGFLHKEISFEDKPVVLLSAANGVGKTTVVDAIEWCLTGNIRRLKTAFDTRSTNNDDRNMNKNGILKYSGAGSDDMVKVTLCIYNGEKAMVLCREQKEDYLEPDRSKVTLDDNEDDAAKFIKEYVGESFYNFHFCDVQKSFNIQSTKREKLPEFFKEFITDYEEYREIADTIDLFADDTKRYIEDKKNQKVQKEVLDTWDLQIESVCSEARKVPYPEIVFYPGEVKTIEKLDKEELEAQKKKVEMCGYLTAKEALIKLSEQEALKKQQALLRSLLADWETKAELIEHTQKIGLFDPEKNIIDSCQDFYNKLEKLSVTKDMILKDVAVVSDLGIAGFNQADFDENLNEIKDSENESAELSKEIALLDGNNSILKLLSRMNAEKAAMVAYRTEGLSTDGVVRCPVCGSETFSTMEEESILKGAADYIAKNNETLQRKMDAKKVVDDKIDSLKEKLLKRVETVVEKEQDRLAEKIIELKNLKDQMEPYFANVRTLMASRHEISSADELNAEIVKSLLDIVDENLLSGDEEKEVTDTYRKILTVLGYSFDAENVMQTLAALESMVKQPLEIVNFSYDLFVEKLNALKGLLADQKVIGIKDQKAAAIEKNQKLDKEIEDLEKLWNIATERAKEIRKIVDELSREEYENVGPVLKKYYDKLARFNPINQFDLKHEKDGISLVDDKGKSIVNILSNGQISVFMLAYFFAGVSSRSSDEKMKIYFIDDLTACMDDVNMLAFLDILKYQMNLKATMEQLFFATCDERISELLEYKMEGCGIKLRVIRDAEFVMKDLEGQRDN